MNSEEKYWQLIHRLSESKPVMKDPDRIRENVLMKVRRLKNNKKSKNLVEGFFFGWINIGWVRRSLVAVAVGIVIFFGYQQAVILRKVNNLSSQRYSNPIETVNSIRDEIPKRLAFYRIAGKRVADISPDFDEKDIDKLVIEINKLKLKYEDLLYMIENDPGLKEYFESKLDQGITDKDTLR